MARIGIDVDGVLRDFARAVVSKFKQEMPDVVKSEEINGWDFPNLSLPRSEWEPLVCGPWARDIYRYAPLTRHARGDFLYLKQWAREEGHELICVSHNPGELGVYTRQWLDVYGFTFQEYHFRQDKENVPLNYLVDDSPVNYERWVGARGDDGYFIMFDQPYNRNVNATHRIYRLKMLTQPQFGVLTTKTVLDQARTLVFEDRGRDYGPPQEDFACAAAMYSAYLGRKYHIKIDLQAEDWPPAMICTKLSREAHKHKRDNLVDIPGYAQAWALAVGDDK